MLVKLILIKTTTKFWLISAKVVFEQKFLYPQATYFIITKLCSLSGCCKKGAPKYINLGGTKSKSGLNLVKKLAEFAFQNFHSICPN
jgi:hypothetical protein